jgi:hypothetical protein
MKFEEPPELQRARVWWDIIIDCTEIQEAARKFLRWKETRTDDRDRSDAEH